jgi:hypothetical protein
MKKRLKKNAPDDLTPEGRRLLKLIVRHVGSAKFRPGDPKTYLGYKKCCVALGIAPADERLPWGRLLQRFGLSDINEWTIRHNFPRVTGLIVNQIGDRQYWPGGDYFASNRKTDMDGPWWKKQAELATRFDWKPYL